MNKTHSQGAITERFLKINGTESYEGRVDQGATLVNEDFLEEVIFQFCKRRRKWKMNSEKAANFLGFSGL